jgi:hypothetical protein
MLRRDVDGKIALARTASGEYQSFVKIQYQCDGWAIGGLARHSRCKNCQRQGCMSRSRETGNKRRTQMLFLTGLRLSAMNAGSFGMRSKQLSANGDNVTTDCLVQESKYQWLCLTTAFQYYKSAIISNFKNDACRLTKMQHYMQDPRGPLNSKTPKLGPNHKLYTGTYCSRELAVGTNNNKARTGQRVTHARGYDARGT